MTREEAIVDIRDNIKPVVGGKSLDMAIEALEQEPCSDAISRKAVLDIINFEDKWLQDAKSHNVDTKMAFWTIKSKISELASVNPNRKAE